MNKDAIAIYAQIMVLQLNSMTVCLLNRVECVLALDSQKHVLIPEQARFAIFQSIMIMIRKILVM